MRALGASRISVAPGGTLIAGWVKNELWRRARAVPSLDLRFADSKSLVDATSGQNLVTFTRASSGTYVDSTGTIKTATTNEARFDHNPTTGESLGLLVEEQRTNLALYSQAINLANWGSQQATTQTLNAATSPDGSLTATLLAENTQAAARFIAQTVAVTNAAYTVSVFAKAKERKRIMFRENTTSGTSATFDLQTGTVAGSEGSPTTSIHPYGNGWYRCVMTYTPSSASSRIHAIYLMPDSGISFATASYTGDGTSGLFLFGFQVELGAFPTSYIPTTTATVTRSADVASITGANFSSWYRQDEGTVFYDATISQGLAAFAWQYNITDGTTSNSFGVYQHTSGIYSAVTSGGVAITPDAANLFSPTPGALLKHAFAVKALDSRAATNGTLSVAQGTTVMPVSPTTLSIGQRVTGNRMTGTIRRLVYWGQRLPNSVLQTITQ